MRKFLSILFAILFLLSCVLTTQIKTSQTALGSSQSIKLRIAWWGSQTRHDRTQKVLELYRAKVNRKVSFVTEFGSWSGYWDKLTTQAAAKNLPDIIQMDYMYLAQYVQKGLLADLTPYTKNGILNLKDVSDASIKSGSIGGKVYAISLGTNALAIIYDPAVAKKAGVKIPEDGNWSWNDYKEIIKKVYQKTKIRADLALTADPKFLLEYYVRQQGKSLYKPDGTSLGFTQEKFIVDVFNINLELLKGGYTARPDEVSATSTIEDSLFVKGKTWIGWTWSNMFVATANAAKRPLALALPPKGGKRAGLYLKPSQFFSVAATSKYKNEAAKVINFFTNSVEANKILLAERGVPISSKVREGIKNAVEPAVRQTFDYIALAEKNCSPIDPPDPSGGTEVGQLFKDLYDQVLYGQIKPEVAAKMFIQKANQILMRNKK
ncbi:ABC transporter substrate-binding protein [Anaerocellum diazotrophicum]|uniref:ABC transporter substrate-binding protein YesO n=1 Tax=Caldicellulosiruptor diazotrophicus TaxID=2806205 RepID=A0ABM7NKB3_9FIRM|nr:extracellular solute-binding protein [Caldicellulosiruptor diazotrophicus]BCS80541.1 putative ABC transporter substrate-binding protein YesO [Caldicellulosiruptor diazotrophicus]